MPPAYDSLCQGVCCVNPVETTLCNVGALVWRTPEGDIGHPCVDEMFVQEFDVLFIGECT